MNDKRQALLFIGLVLAISWAYEAYIAFHGGVERFGIPGLLILMWIPGLLSILLRLTLRSGFEDVRFIFGKPRYYAYALLIPLALAVLTGLVCAIFDVRRFALIEPDDLAGPAASFCRSLASACLERLVKSWDGADFCCRKWSLAASRIRISSAGLCGPPGIFRSLRLGASTERITYSLWYWPIA